LLTLIGLYALSAVAASVLLIRGVAKPESRGLLKAPALLSGAKKDSVAWISLHGAIYQSDGGGVLGKGARQVARRIERLADKSEVKAIVLDINSPGGSVGAVQELHSLILRVRREKKKPVVAVLGDVAASGGYYVAAACDKVVAHPGTLLGSIGVIFNVSNVEGLLGKLGIRSEAIKSGKMKDIGSMSRPMTAEERQLLQAMIDNAYGQFLRAVADGRGMPEDKVRPLADGRIFTGEQGLGLGLVDKLGDSKEAIALAAGLGGIKGEPKILRDSDSISSVLDVLDSRGAEFLGSRLAGTVGPELEFLRELGALGYTGLEYRWGR